MNHGWKTRIEERRYFEEKKKAQQELALERLNLMKYWENEKRMLELSKNNGHWSIF